MRKDYRLHYRCARCTRIYDVDLGQDCLRMLHLYVLMKSGTGNPLPVHSKPLRLFVHAPPQEWRWSSEAHVFRDRPQASYACASPTHGTDPRGLFLRYSRDESNGIWMHSASYLGEPTQ